MAPTYGNALQAWRALCAEAATSGAAIAQSERGLDFPGGGSILVRSGPQPRFPARRRPGFPRRRRSRSRAAASLGRHPPPHAHRPPRQRPPALHSQRLELVPQMLRARTRPGGARMAQLPFHQLRQPRASPAPSWTRCAARRAKPPSAANTWPNSCRAKRASFANRPALPLRPWQPPRAPAAITSPVSIGAAAMTTPPWSCWKSPMRARAGHQRSPAWSPWNGSAKSAGSCSARASWLSPNAGGRPCCWRRRIASASPTWKRCSTRVCPSRPFYTNGAQQAAAVRGAGPGARAG